MKKRIFISIAVTVFLLEVGFGVYVAFERKYEYALNRLSLPIDVVKQVETGTDSELEIAGLLPVEDFVPDTQVIVVAKKPRVRPASSSGAVKKLAPTSIAAAKPSKLRTRTEPDKQAVALKTNEIREIPAGSNGKKATSHTDDKSFIAKTLSTLKKPFGWIKAIGSKLP